MKKHLTNQSKNAAKPLDYITFQELPVIDEVVVGNEESVVGINDISVEEVVADFYETDAVSQEAKAEEQIVNVVVKAEFKAFKERMGYVGAKLAIIQYKMEIYDEFREEYYYRKRYHKVEEVRTVDRSRGAR